MQIGGTTFNVGERYTPLKFIGSGSYGFVISALDNITQEKIAIKKLHQLEDIGDAKRVLREIRILRNVNHENIIQLKNIIYNEAPDQSFGEMYLVMELMDIDLYKVIYSKQELTDEHIQYILYQILRALVYLHSVNIIHRDLKPSNILATENCDIKLCDLGLARNVDEKPGFKAGPGLTEYVITRYYRAPEVMLTSNSYSKAVDIWGLGCTMYELFSHQVLFKGENYIQQIKLIISTLGTPDEEDMEFISNDNAKKYIQSLPKKPQTKISCFVENNNPLALDLLDQLLRFNPKKRITAEQALEHPYFQSLHDPEDEPKFTGSIDFDFDKQRYILRGNNILDIRNNNEPLIDLQMYRYRIEYIQNQREENNLNKINEILSPELRFTKQKD